MPTKNTYPAAACWVCRRLSPTELLELDSLVADPASWPSTVWGLFEPPKGGLPASYRRFGANRMAEDWLRGHGYGDEPGFRVGVRRHVRFDVAHVARTTAEMVSLGVIRAAAPDTRIPTAPVLNAGAFIDYFNAGIQMGAAAQRLLAERINAVIDAGGEPDPKLVMKLADLGASFARTQATLMAKGLKFGQEEDEDDAFRGPADERPSERIGGHRIRTIDGERRPVRDEGPKDRERYNRRAIEEGGLPLD